MASLSVGIDIVEVPRVGRLIRRRRFLERVFSAREAAYCRGKKNAAQHFAVRFAAKEAVYKALGRGGVPHRDIGVRNRPDGKPEVELRGVLKRFEKKISLSLSHTAKYAAAVAIYQR